MKRFLVLAFLFASTLLTAAFARADERQEDTARRVRDALRRDYYLDRYRLDTDTVGRTIEVEGRVRYNFERRRAIIVARRYARDYPIRSRIRVRR